MTMRYGTDEAEEGRRRLRRSPIQKDPRPVRIDPGGNVTPAQRPTPKRTTQPRAVGRQTVNQETIDPSSRGRFAPEFQRVLDRNATMQNDARAARMQSPMVAPGDYSARGYGTGLDGEDWINPDPGVPNDPSNVELGRVTVPWSDRFVPPVERRRTVRQSQRPKASPVPFAQQLAQSGMMNTQPIWDYSTGQGVRAPGYSVNPMHPMWQSSSIPQFRTGQNPMDYYGGDAFRGSMPYRMPQMPGAVQGMWDVGSGGGQIPQQTTPRVWRGSEMTPEGFRGIMNQYGANIPWMQQMQSMPYPVPMMPFGF